MAKKGGKNTVVTEFSDGDSLKKLRNELKKTKGGFDALATSQRGADRAAKGMTGQSSNASKNFSKIQQGISGGLVPAYATLAAQVFAVTAAFQFLSNAVDYRNLIAGQEAFGASTGTTYKTITKDIQAATEGQLRYQEAAQAAAIGIAAGLTSEQITEIGVAAKNTSLALGRNLTDSFNRLTRGITKAEPELLDELGIILRLDPALKAYADKIGKSKEQLNQFEKSQAVANEVLGQAESKFGKIAEEIPESAFALQQFAIAFDDLLNNVKAGLGAVITPIVSFLSKNVAALTAALGLFALPIIKSILPNFDEMGKAARVNFGIVQAEIGETQMKMALMTGDQRGLRAGAATGINDLRAREGLKPVGTMHGQMTGASIAKQKAQLEKGGKMREMFNKRERALYRRHLKMQELSLQISEAKKRKEFQKTATFVKLKQKEVELFYRKSQLRMIGFTEKAAKAMNKAFFYMGLLGAAALVLTALGSMLAPIFAASEAQQKFNEDLEQSIERQKTLNEELARMNRMRPEAGLERSVHFGTTLLSTTATKEIQAMQDAFEEQKRILIQEGEDLKSLDFVTKNVYGEKEVHSVRHGVIKTTGKIGERVGVRDKELDKNRQNTIDTILKLKNNAVGPLRDEYQKLYKQLLDGEKIDEDQLERVAELEREHQSLTDRVKKQAEVSKSFQQSLTGMAGKGLPYQAQRRALNDMLKTQEAIIESTIRGGKEPSAFDKERLQELLDFKDTLAGIVKLEKERLKTIEINKRTRSEAQRAVTTREKLNVADTKNLAAQEKLTKAQQDEKAARAAVFALKLKGYKTEADFRDKAGKLDKKALQDYIDGGGILEENVQDAEYSLTLAEDKVKTAETELETQKHLTEQEKIKLRIALNNLSLQKQQLALSTSMLERQTGEVGFNTMFGGTKFGARQKKAFDLENSKVKAAQDALAIETQITNLAERNLDRGSEEFLKEQASIDNNKAKLELLRKQNEFQEEALTLGGELQMSFAKGIEDMFTAFAQGSKTAKEAMRDFTVFMLKKLAEIAAQQLAMNMLTGMFGIPIPRATGGVIPMAAGGIAMRKYSTGGIATQPTYLVGEGKYNEAVVPLPDGRTIPVEMRGGAGNNITVNVDANGGQQTTMDGAQGAALGKAIAATVMETIQREKRPGGVLSR